VSRTSDPSHRARFLRAEEWASERSKALQAGDPEFSFAVHLQHADGSSMVFENASLQLREGILVLFTEHHGWRVYDPEDLHHYAQYRGVQGGVAAEGNGE
jgi:hypothetical protein